MASNSGSSRRHRASTASDGNAGSDASTWRKVAPPFHSRTYNRSATAGSNARRRRPSRAARAATVSRFARNTASANSGSVARQMR